MRNLTNQLGLSEFIVNGINPVPEEITVTDLVDSPRIRMLKANNYYAQDIAEDLFDDMVSEAILERIFADKDKNNFIKAAISLESFFSVATEKMDSIVKVRDYLLSLSNFSRDYYNNKIRVEVEGRALYGAIPFYNSEKETLYNVKYCTSQKYAHKKTRELWARELNVLAWMLMQEGHEVKELRTVFFISNLRGFGERVRPANYPKNKFFEEVIPMDDLNETANFILYQMGQHILAETKLPECTAKQRWSEKSLYEVYAPRGRKPMRADYDEKVIDTFIHKNNFRHQFDLRKRTVNGKPLRCPTCVVQEFCDQYQLELRTIKK